MGRKSFKFLKIEEGELDNVLQENRELLYDFIQYLEATDHSKETVKIYESNLKLFFVWLMKYCRNKDFVDIKKRDIMNFQNYMLKGGLSPARIRNIRSSISSLSDFIERILDEEEKFENFRNIVNKIPAPTLVKTREKTVLDSEQLENLLDTLVEKKKYQIACCIAMLAYSGCRKSEIIQYKDSYFTDETLKGGLYVTPEIRTKGKGNAGKKLKKYAIKSKVDIYLNLWREQRKELGVEIDDLFVVKRDGKWECATKYTIESWMEICEKILKVPTYAHMYRHYFVSELKRQGLPLDVIQKIVG